MSRADEPKSPDTVTAITRPSKTAKAAFGAPGIVMDVKVVEGQPVKKGDVLAIQDDRQDQAKLESMKLDAQSTAEIDYSTIDLGVKKVQYDRQLKMQAQHVATASEVEEKKLAVDLADAQIDIAKLKHRQKEIDAQTQAIKIEQEKIIAPFDGIVQKLNVETGEMADPQNRDGALTIVKNDPLWVEMHLPTQQALRLQPNQVLQVKYADRGTWQPAKVILLDPQADAASDTERVRLELPNPSQQVSGLQVQVKLPDAGVASSN